MLRRKMYDTLLNWKESKHQECLLIKGARQVGKTYLVEQFGKNEYESFIEINFLEEATMKSIFEGPLTANEIYKRISYMKPDAELIPGKTLVFLDEIQLCSKARTALKFLALDDKYDFIASGSLLGLHYGTDADKEVEPVESVPVGYESQLVMYSLDFEEFMWANGLDDDKVAYLRTFFESGERIPDAINESTEQLFREYICVGGMPEVVSKYVKNHDFGEVSRIQNKILAAYDDDITNHAKKTARPKVRRCYNSLPGQLAKDNKKFSYAKVEKGTGSKKYGDSITWLCDSNLVNQCKNVHEPYIPLLANQEDDEFKLYVNDTGLLMAMYGDQAKQLVLNNTIRGNAKGGIYENVISECLLKNGYTLHYYKPSSNSQEIEFIIEKDCEVMPIEVKAGNTSTISLNNFITEFKPSSAYKLVNGNVGFNGAKKTYPHYMVIFI